MTSRPADPDRSPVFVVGTGRSGTTLLRMMLNAHPRIYLTHEASFYLSTFGLPAGSSAVQWLERYARTAAFAFLGIHPDEVRARLPGDRGGLPDAFRAVMRCKADRYGKARYGDKTPLHTLYLGRIFNEFEEPRVVHMVRDPRGTVASLLRMPWAPSSVALNSLYCDQQMKAVRPFAGRIHEVRLEDLLRNPEPVMRGILEFVGEPWDHRVLDHPAHAPLDDLPPFPWFERASGKPGGQRERPAWRDLLSPAWIRIVEHMNRFGMQRYGYPRAELAQEPGLLARGRARFVDFFRAIRSLVRLRRFARLYNKKRLPEPQLGMETLLSVNPGAWRHYPGFEMPRIRSPE